MSASFKITIAIVALLTLANVTNLVMLHRRDDWTRADVEQLRKDVENEGDRIRNIQTYLQEVSSQVYEDFSKIRNLEIRELRHRREIARLERLLNGLRALLDWLGVPDWLLWLIFHPTD